MFQPPWAGFLMSQSNSPSSFLVCGNTYFQGHFCGAWKNISFGMLPKSSSRLSSQWGYRKPEKTCCTVDIFQFAKDRHGPCSHSSLKGSCQGIIQHKDDSGTDKCTTQEWNVKLKQCNWWIDILKWHFLIVSYKDSSEMEKDSFPLDTVALLVLGRVSWICEIFFISRDSSHIIQYPCKHKPRRQS